MAQLIEPSTPYSLLLAARNGQPEAWGRFVHLYGPLVYRWIRRAGLQSSDAADVTQDVLMSVSKDLVRFDPNHPEVRFRAWLWTITRNKVHDLARRRTPMPLGGSAAQRQLSQVPEDLPGDDPTNSNTTTTIAHRAVQLVQGEFESQTWEAFRRVTMEGQRPVDVANDLGMTLGAVCTAKWRVLKRLRAEMQDLW